jgi:hypothetical protein
VECTGATVHAAPVQAALEAPSWVQQHRAGQLRGYVAVSSSPLIMCTRLFACIYVWWHHCVLVKRSVQDIRGRPTGNTCLIAPLCVYACACACLCAVVPDVTTSSLASFIGGEPRDVSDAVLDGREEEDDRDGGWVGVGREGSDSGWLCPLCYMMNPRTSDHCAVCFSAVADSDMPTSSSATSGIASTASAPAIVTGAGGGGRNLSLAPHVLEFETEALSAFGPAPSAAASSALHATGSLHAAVAAVIAGGSGGVGPGKVDPSTGRAVAAPKPDAGTAHPGSYVHAHAIEHRSYRVACAMK